MGEKNVFCVKTTSREGKRLKQKQVCGFFTFLYCFVINDVAETVTYNSGLIYHQKNPRNIKKIKTLESREVFSELEGCKQSK